MNFRHLMNFNLYRGSHIRNWKWFDVDYGVKITIATRMIVYKIECQIRTHWWSLSRSLVNQTCPRGQIHPHKRVNLIWLSTFEIFVKKKNSNDVLQMKHKSCRNFDATIYICFLKTTFLLHEWMHLDSCIF